MSLLSEPKMTIAKLNNTNYQLWKFKVEMLLLGKELWTVILDDLPDPMTEAWQKKDQKARSDIVLLLEDDQLVHVREQVNAKGMWNELKRVHERTNLNNKLYLLRKLYTSRLKQGQPMQQHLNSMLETVVHLRGIGEEIKENNVAVLMLCSLPASYGSLVTAIEARPEGELTLEYIKGKLLDEYNRRKENGEEDHDNLAQQSETVLKAGSAVRHFERKNIYERGNDQQQIIRGTETRTCYYCKRQGHIKPNCLKLKSDKAKKGHKVKGAIQENNSAEENNAQFCFKVMEDSAAHREWCIDSGATSHMCNSEHFFSKLDKSKTGRVALADDRYVNSQGCGDGYLTCSLPNKQIRRILVKNVLFVPELSESLLSVKKLTQMGCIVTFRDKECRITKNDVVLAVANSGEQLYKLECRDTGTESANAVQHLQHKNCIHEWHRKLGHRDPAAIKKLVAENLASGIELKDCNQMLKCMCCVKGKMTDKAYPKQSENVSRAPLHLVHTDLCGPMNTATPSGNKYFLTFIDDYSKYTVTYLLKKKSETREKLEEYIAMTENIFQSKIKILRSDRGGEYVGEQCQKLLRSNGIKHEMTVGYAPQQNGVAERKNRSLVEMARCMLIEAGMSYTYWGEAVNTATYLQNRLPTKGCMKTPYEAWTGKIPKLDHLQPFGTRVLSFVPNVKRTKLENKAEEGIFVGYSEQSKGYRILHIKSNRISICRSVIFDETDTKQVFQSYERPHQQAVMNTERPSTTEEMVSIQQKEMVDDTEIVTDAENVTTPRRSTRATRGVPPQRFPDEFAYKATIEPVCEPKTWNDVLSLERSERVKWETAANEEMNVLHKNKTWDLVELPEGKKAIGCRWIFKAKQNATGEVTKYKARVVAKGYAQQFGEDYEETYAPVIKQSTIRTLLAIASMKKLQVRHADVKSAFLNGDLTEEIFMEQPDGYVERGKENYVCRLKRSIYGLKQSARSWYAKVNETLSSMNFTRSRADPCLYVRKEGEHWTYIIVHVDDLLICDTSDEEIDELMERMNEVFEITNLGKVTFYLGIQIERAEDGVFKIHQSAKIKQIAEIFRMSEAKGVSTPMQLEYPRIVSEDGLLPSNEQYRQCIGSLLYIATTTRPDIAASIGMLCRRVSKPRQCDWEAAKRVIKYLMSTIDTKLILGKGNNVELICFVDADWAGSAEDRKSTSGSICIIGESCISWSSRKQTSVALSSTEAEYVAAASACQEISWIRQLLTDLGFPPESATTVYEDNQSCISIATSEKNSQRTKHMDVKYHYLRDLIESEVIVLKHCASENMIADAFTKPLTRDRLCLLNGLMNLASH